MSHHDQHVVAGVDGSDVSIALLDWAATYATIVGADVKVVGARCRHELPDHRSARAEDEVPVALEDRLEHLRQADVYARPPSGGRRERRSRCPVAERIQGRAPHRRWCSVRRPRHAAPAPPSGPCCAKRLARWSSYPLRTQEPRPPTGSKPHERWTRLAGAPWVRRSVLVRDGGAWPEPLGHPSLPARAALVGRAVRVTSRGAPVVPESHDLGEDAGVVADDAADAVPQHGFEGVLVVDRPGQHALDPIVKLGHHTDVEEGHVHRDAERSGTRDQPSSQPEELAACASRQDRAHEVQVVWPVRPPLATTCRTPAVVARARPRAAAPRPRGWSSGAAP